MLRLVWRPRAQVDRESIALYLGFECGNPQAAHKIISEIDKALEQACDLPEIGKPFLHNALERYGYRQLIVGSYTVFYTHDENELTVRRVLHQHRSIDDYALMDLAL